MSNQNQKQQSANINKYLAVADRHLVDEDIDSFYVVTNVYANINEQLRNDQAPRKIVSDFLQLEIEDIKELQDNINESEDFDITNADDSDCLFVLIDIIDMLQHSLFFLTSPKIHLNEGYIEKYCIEDESNG